MFTHTQLDAGRRSALNALGAIQIFMGIAFIVKESIDMALQSAKTELLTGEPLSSSVYFDRFWYGVLCCFIGLLSVNCGRMSVQSPTRPALRCGIFFNLVLTATSAVLFCLHVSFTRMMVGLLLGSSLGKTLFTFMLTPVCLSAAVYCCKIKSSLPDVTITTTTTHQLPVYPCHGYGHQGTLAAPPAYPHASAPSSISVHIPANSYITSSMMTH